jgi:multidrug efflux pump subunit AcrB
MRYNGYPAAELNGGPAPASVPCRPRPSWPKSPAEQLPKGMAFEWTDLTYQRILAGNTAVYVYPLCILLVFLVLAAQYESFRLPLAIILVVPLCLLFAIAGRVAGPAATTTSSPRSASSCWSGWPARTPS